MAFRLALAVLGAAASVLGAAAYERVRDFTWVQGTEAFAKAAAEVAARARKELGATKLELRLTGRASDLANKEAAALGWSVVERVQ
jgi:hypothetical protein